MDAQITREENTGGDFVAARIQKTKMGNWFPEEKRVIGGEMGAEYQNI